MYYRGGVYCPACLTEAMKDAPDYKRQPVRSVGGGEWMALQVPMTDAEATAFGRSKSPVFDGNGHPVGDTSIVILRELIAYGKQAERYLASEQVKSQIAREDSNGDA